MMDINNLDREARLMTDPPQTSSTILREEKNLRGTICESFRSLTLMVWELRGYVGYKEREERGVRVCGVCSSRPAGPK